MAYRTTTTTVLLQSQSLKESLHFVVKRYVPDLADPQGLTLLFLHCTGSHKEVWEPVIQHAFPLLKDTALIREAWSFDWQSHGEAAVLNEEVLNRHHSCFSVSEWAKGLKAFVQTGVLNGHTLIAVGHSSGASAALLSTIANDSPAVAYNSLILVEPSPITRSEFDAHLSERTAALELTFKAVAARCDTWNNREDARLYMKKRLPWKIWDDGVLNVFVKYALRPVQLQVDSDTDAKVTLCCSKQQERTSYDDNDPHFLAVETLAKLDALIPVHFILGSRYDVVPKYAHDSIIALRPTASILRVARAGHFVVQGNPEGTAFAIVQAISSLSARAPAARL